MSYCRGDVYCYGTLQAGINGDRPCWVIHISYLLESPFSGATFQLSTLQDLRKKFLELRSAGVPVPDKALARVEREIAADE